MRSNTLHSRSDEETSTPPRGLFLFGPARRGPGPAFVQRRPSHALADHSNQSEERRTAEGQVRNEKPIRPLAYVSEPEDMEAVFTCSVCLDFYQTPKNLPNCGHCYCTPCLEQAIQRDVATNTYRIVCPDCRSVNIIGYSGVTELKTNIQLQRGAEYLRRNVPLAAEKHVPSSPPKSASMADVCPHQRMPNTILCEHCQSKFCPKCQINHMELMKIEILAQKNELQKRVETALDGMDSKLTAIKESIEGNLTEVKKGAWEAREALESQIKRAIEDKFTGLMREIEPLGTDQLKHFENIVNNVEGKREKDFAICAEIDELSGKSVLHCQLADVAKLYQTISGRSEEVGALERLKSAEIESLIKKVSFIPDSKLEREVLARIVSLNFGCIESRRVESDV